ncbi:PAAR-like protein [Paenibacillus tyrfis]|uniref:PAAR-like protein n=1 Tax=Paenibacillus tyrfis TaxID=1501230 RepID=UPI00209EB141|nr:PAAR-like protein [Paenibacillus tyrfis]MCP1311451.1 DUF4280 domain-containing protein [Paenibacillus tyrfis]
MTKATTGAQVKERKQTIAERIADIKRDLSAGKAPLLMTMEGLGNAGSGGVERSFVVEGATAACSCGSKESRLKAPANRQVYINDKIQLNVTDSKPYVNVDAFGYCSSLNNPDVAEATKASNGQLRPMPCSPMIGMPWMALGKPNVIVGQDQALLSYCMVSCMYNGQIRITDDGQGQTVDAGAGQDRKEAEAVLLLNMAANEMLLKLKKDWKPGGTEAATADVIRRQIGGTVTREDASKEVSRLVGNDKILAAKKLYAEGKVDDAKELARIGREMGGTILLEDDVETAQRMVANEYIYMAKRKWQEAHQAGDRDKKIQAVQLGQAARKLGGTITDDHSLEEAGRILADERNRVSSTYNNHQGRAWNGFYDRKEWENEAQYLYNLTQEPGGNQWASERLLLVESILYGTRSEANAAYNKINNVNTEKQVSSSGAGKSSTSQANTQGGKFENGIISAQDAISRDPLLNKDACYISNLQNFPLYSQSDQRYADEKIGNDTMKKSGCTITGVAAISAWKTNGQWPNGVEPHPGRYKNKATFTPTGLLEWGSIGLAQPGYCSYKNNSTDFESEVKGAVDRGNPVLIGVNGASHWIVVIGYKKEGDVIVYDTADGSVGTFDEVNKNREESRKPQYKSVSRYYEFP